MEGQQETRELQEPGLKEVESPPIVFLHEVAPIQVENLPGVYIQKPPPLDPFVDGIMPPIVQTELFSVIDERPWAACAACGKDHRRDLVVRGPERSLQTDTPGVSVAGRLIRYACSEECRAKFLEWNPDFEIVK